MTPPRPTADGTRYHFPGSVSVGCSPVACPVSLLPVFSILPTLSQFVTFHLSLLVPISHNTVAQSFLLSPRWCYCLVVPCTMFQFWQCLSYSECAHRKVGTVRIGPCPVCCFPVMPTRVAGYLVLYFHSFFSASILHRS